jgi:quercetin dioxygenase-like cupin family protein
MGTGIEGSDKSQKLAKGDILLVPAETAHQFQDVKDEFVILSVHMLMPDK